MGLFDDIRKAITGDANNTSRASPPPRPSGGLRGVPPGLQEAWRARKVAPDMRRLDGKERSFKGYEHLERLVSARVGRFPWSDAEAVEALRASGIDESAARSYLASPAASRLLGRG